MNTPNSPHHAYPPRVTLFHQPQLWEQFANAKTLESFCLAWQQLFAAQQPSIKAMAILVEHQQQFVPISVWPQASKELARLSTVVERCLQQKSAQIQLNAQTGLLELAYPLLQEQGVLAIIAAEAQATLVEGQHLLHHLHWGSAWLTHIIQQQQHSQASQVNQQQRELLDALAISLQIRPLQHSLFDIANDLKQRLNSHKVAIALRYGQHLQLKALSETASFDKNTPQVKAYVAAMEETMDVGQLCVYQAAAVETTTDTPQYSTEKSNTTKNQSQNQQPTNELGSTLPLHQQLAHLAQSSLIVSLPLTTGNQTVGVLLCEYDQQQNIDKQQQTWLNTFVALLAPIIQQRQAAQRHSVSRLAGEIRALGQRLFGKGHLIWKTAAISLCLLLVVLNVWQVDYRVSAKTVIEGEIQRVASAPFAGFIASTSVKAGDSVKQGQVLAQLDDRELQLERSRWASERDQYQAKLREAVAQHKLSEVQIINAQYQQAQAQWQLVNDKIHRAILRAPFDGLVVAGDLSQQIGAPVELGKELFTITPLRRYRVILQIDERDIAFIKRQQHGELVMIGLTGEPMPFKVHHITTIASQADGKNFFKVEALLDSFSPRLRPGMEGIGKITTEQRSLAWVLFHPLGQWVSLMMWKWLP